MARIGLGLSGMALLGISALKILHFESFLDSLDGYQVFSDALLEPAGILLVGAQGAVALGLCIPKFQRKAALGLIGLMVLFAFAIGSSLLNGMSIDCGCFSALIGPTKISWLMVWRNLAIALGLALAVICSAERNETGLWPGIKTFLVSHFRTLFAVTVIAAMAASTIWLVQNNHILSLRLAAYTPSQLLKPGDSVPPLKATRVGGGEEGLKFSGDKKMILILFSPQCAHCQQSIEWWNSEIARDRLKSNPINVVGVSVVPEVPREFMDQFHVSFPIYIPDSMRKFHKAFPVQAVPATLFINPDGKVAFSYDGFPPHQTGFEGVSSQ